jgi:hypothetical protein
MTASHVPPEDHRTLAAKMTIILIQDQFSEGSALVEALMTQLSFDPKAK